MSLVICAEVQEQDQGQGSGGSELRDKSALTSEDHAQDSKRALQSVVSERQTEIDVSEVQQSG